MHLVATFLQIAEYSATDKMPVELLYAGGQRVCEELSQLHYLLVIYSLLKNSIFAIPFLLHRRRLPEH
jgi:hypothetical protein